MGRKVGLKDGVLNKTKCTVIGPMQYYNGREIRNYFKKELGQLGITVYDHYNKPFLDKLVDENEKLGGKLKKWLEQGKYDEITKYRKIRWHDLALAEKSDLIIVHFIPGVVSVGMWEEFFLVNSIKRPIFFITEGGKDKTPIWVFWTIPHKYIYSSKEDVVKILKKINNGQVKLDSSRWRLMREDFR